MSKRTAILALALVLGGAALLFFWPESPGAKGAADRKAQSQSGAAAARRASAATRAPLAHPLKKSGAIGGRIVDPDRKGVAGAQVCAVSFADGFTNEDQHNPNCVLTDALGRFAFPYLWAGSHSIEATARGYLPSNDIDGAAPAKAWDGALELEEGQERDDIVIVLSPGGVELVGEVTDVGGGPIAGAWVELHPRSSTQRNLPTASARAVSDEEGIVRLWLGEGTYTVEASAEGYVGERSELIVPGMRLRVALVPASSLRGRVVYGQSGEPTPFAEVSASKEKFGGYTARADENGEFTFTRLPAGRYQVSAASEDGRGAAARSVVLELGQDVDGVVVPLEPGVRVAGVVVRKGSDEPCDNARGMLIQEDRRRPMASKAGDEAGAIRFDAVPPGNYQVMVGCDSGARDPADALEVKTEDILDQSWTVDEGLSLRVRVRDESGAAVPMAEVMVSDANDMFARRGGFGQSDAEGVATVRSLSKGKLKVEVHADALAMRDSAPTIDLEGDGQEITVVMIGGGSIAGVVRASTGELPGGLIVSARADKGDDPLAQMMASAMGSSAMVLDDGSFHIEGLTAGSYRLQVSQDRWSFQGIETEENESYQVSLKSVTKAHLTIAGRSGSVRGRVVDSRNQPVGDAFVRVIPDSGGDLGGFAAMQLRDSFFSKDATLTDTDGRFEVHGLAKGPYMVRAYRRGGGEVVEKDVAEGSDLTLAIVDTGSIAGTVLSSSGTPVKSYSIRCNDTKTKFDREERFSGDGGQFKVDDLPPGSYVVSVTSNEGTAVSDDVPLAVGAAVEGMTLRLQASGTLLGRVVSLEDATPVAGMRINARSARGDLRGGSLSRLNATGADGRFKLEGVPAGPVVLFGYQRGLPGKSSSWGPVSTRATIPPGGEVDVGDLVVAQMQTSYKEAGDLGFDLKDRNFMDGEGLLIVGTVDEEGPAHEAGLRTGDEIVAINGQDLTGGKAYLFTPLTIVPVGSIVRLGLESGVDLSIRAVPRKSE